MFSEAVDLPSGPAPITVAIEFMSFDAGPGSVTIDFPKDHDPQEQIPNPVLTVYYVENNKFFRVGVTNLASLPIIDLVVRWWLLNV